MSNLLSNYWKSLLVKVLHDSWKIGFPVLENLSSQNWIGLYKSKFKFGLENSILLENSEELKFVERKDIS